MTPEVSKSTVLLFHENLRQFTLFKSRPSANFNLIVFSGRGKACSFV